MSIQKSLRYTGILVLILGIIISLIGFFSMDHEAYSDAKEIYESIPDNEYASAEFTALQFTRISQLSYVFGTFFAGLIGGLLLLGFSKHLELQERLAYLVEYNKDNIQDTKFILKERFKQS